MWQTAGQTNIVAGVSLFLVGAAATESGAGVSSFLRLQINGKLRGTVEVSKTISQDDALAAGTALDNVARQTKGKTIRKVIFVPGKILNIIVG